MAHEYLVIFQYHEPERRELFERGLIENYESSSGVFIETRSAEDALIWCEVIAQELLRRANDDRSLDWKRLGYSCWIESAPEIPLGPLLGFFSARSRRRAAEHRRDEYCRVRSLAGWRRRKLAKANAFARRPHPNRTQYTGGKCAEIKCQLSPPSSDVHSAPVVDPIARRVPESSTASPCRYTRS